MRLTSVVQSSLGILLLTSACTIENTTQSADSDKGGNPNSQTAGSGAHSAGANNANTANTSNGGASIVGTSSASGGASSTNTGAAVAGAPIGSNAGADSGKGGANATNGGTMGAGAGFANGGVIAAGASSATGGAISTDANSAAGRTAGGNAAVAGFAASGRATIGTNVGGAVAATGGATAAGGGAPLGGAAGSSAFGGSNAAGSGNLAKALPPTVFVFERKIASGRDHLVAMDVVTHEQRVITTLADGSVEGWNLDGVSVSPDRTRIVIASLYGPTAADVATGLATNRLWSLDIDGSDFRRLTPVFPNQHAGQTGWRIDVRDPAISPDGQYVVFDYGEGDFQGGYVAPWVVPADGSALPSLVQTNFDCSVNGNATFHPLTGDLLLEHAVCIGGQKGGYFLYPNGGGEPDFLVNDDGISLSSEPPAFSADGSLFVFSGRTYSDNIQSLYAYGMSVRAVAPLILGSVGTDIVNATFSPDDRYMVYCVRSGDLYDLRVLDFSVDPPADAELTSDGISCDAVF